MSQLFSGRFLITFAAFAALSSPPCVAAEKPLRVFVLAGQSNMQGHAHVRTFERMGMDPQTKPILAAMTTADGSPVVCDDVWISSIGSAEEEQTGQLTAGFGAQARGPKIGPEFTFGIYMHKQLQEPILLIKTAWGGKSLHTDFRPPGAGAYQFNESQLAAFQKQRKDLSAIKADKERATGHYYRLMIEHVHKVLADIKRVYPDYDEQAGYELAGFVWFQGWNDMVDRGTYPKRDQPGGYDQYSKLMAQFIRDVRRDLKAPRLPFVIGVMGVGGPVDQYLPDQRRYAGIHQNFRDAMAAPAALPEFRANVAAVRTEQYWDMELAGLRAREAQVRQQIRKRQAASELTKQQARAAEEEARASEFSERELRILKTGVSNFEFHYLGSARIMAQIGKGFAEAMAGLLSTQPQPRR